MKLDIIKSGWLENIVYIEGLQVIISKKYCISFSEDRFILANSVHPDEMLHNAAFHLCFHCLQKYPIRGLLYTKDYCINNNDIFT